MSILFLCMGGLFSTYPPNLLASSAVKHSCSTFSPCRTACVSLCRRSATAATTLCNLSPTCKSNCFCSAKSTTLLQLYMRGVPTVAYMQRHRSPAGMRMTHPWRPPLFVITLQGRRRTSSGGVSRSVGGTPCPKCPQRANTDKPNKSEWVSE